MNGGNKERSYSEVGTDTLRYFNSMNSSHSWCCSDYDSLSNLPLLNSLPYSQKAATASAAVKAIAVAAAVSGENFEGSLNDTSSLSSDPGIIIMNDLRLASTDNDRW